MSKTLDLAITKSSALPTETQDQIGREILQRVGSISDLKRDIAVGASELDAGLGKPLDVDALIAHA